jgi:hypothetical protein
MRHVEIDDFAAQPARVAVPRPQISVGERVAGDARLPGAATPLFP